MDVRDQDIRSAAAAIAKERAAQATKHPEVAELVAYHEHELPAARTEELQAHLAVCRACGDLVLELHRIEREESGPLAACMRWLERTFDIDLSSTWRTLLKNEDRSGSAVVAFRRAPALIAAAAILLVAPAVYLTYQSLRTAQVPAIGTYAMDLRGELQAMRGTGENGADEVFHFAPGLTFDLSLYPMDPVQGEVEVQAFRSDDGKLLAWSVPVEISDEGAARIKGRVGSEIVLPPGSSIVFVTVGRPGEIPAPEDLEQRLAATNSVQEREWAAWRVHISLEDERELP